MDKAYKNDVPVDWSGSGESVAVGCAFRYRAKLPTGIANLFATKAKWQEHRAEAPGLSEAREKAEAVPVESKPAVEEIHFHKILLTVKGKSTRVFS